MSLDADVLEALRALVAELKGLRADVRDRNRPMQLRSSSLSRDDRVLLARWLPAIGGALGSNPFLARDLFEHPSAALRLVRRGLNAKRIGRLFQRAEGQAVDGYLVEDTGDEELHSILWRVVQVPGFSGNEKVSVPPRDPAGLP